MARMARIVASGIKSSLTESFCLQPPFIPALDDMPMMATQFDSLQISQLKYLALGLHHEVRSNNTLADLVGRVCQPYLRVN